MDKGGSGPRRESCKYQFCNKWVDENEFKRETGQSHIVHMSICQQKVCASRSQTKNLCCISLGLTITIG